SAPAQNRLLPEQVANGDRNTYYLPSLGWHRYTYFLVFKFGAKLYLPSVDFPVWLAGDRYQHSTSQLLPWEPHGLERFGNRSWFKSGLGKRDSLLVKSRRVGLLAQFDSWILATVID